MIVLTPLGIIPQLAQQPQKTGKKPPRPVRIVSTAVLKKTLSLKREAVKRTYGHHITHFQYALQSKDVGRGAAILVNIPAVLRDTFCKVSSLPFIKLK